MLLALSCTLALGACAPLQEAPKLELTSGRPIPPEQACYDVTFYELNVRVDPEARAIEGRVHVIGRMLAESDAIVLDLDARLEVRGVEARAARTSAIAPPSSFQHANGEIRVHAPQVFRRLDQDFEVIVGFGGKPREAPRPPWDGGFVWSKTASGAPWIATANQMQGADLWWPCKDQPDDEAEGARIRVTVPEPLVCASNGALTATTDEDCIANEIRPGWKTYEWSVNTPINTYGIALNIAPYQTISRDYTSVAGDTFPVTYWVLPENVEQGKVLFEDILRQMRFMEETYGPYPFRRDKYGVAETPHLGMEHQSIIAYGNRYSGNPWGEQYGFDMLHLHEFAHEWWANLVTCANWNDFWIHEGFASYTQALYVERLQGEEGYFREMQALSRGIRNRAAIAPREKRSTAEMYFGDREGSPGGDIYNKGAWVLHSLRWVVGDEVFAKTLRRMAYPDPALEKTNDGSACRFATTDELRSIAEHEAEQELDWFFEVYLRQAGLPELVSRVENGALSLEWRRPNGRAFPMPVEVEIGGERRRVECPDGKARVALEEGTSVLVDPRRRVLRR